VAHIETVGPNRHDIVSTDGDPTQNTSGRAAFSAANRFERAGRGSRSNSDALRTAYRSRDGGFGLIGAAGFAIQEGTLEEVSEIVSQTAPSQVLAGVSLDMIGSVFFVLFVAGVWARLRSREPSPAWLSVAALASGLLGVAASFIDKTMFYSLYSLGGEGLEAETARVLFLTARASFLLFTLFAGAMAGIAAVPIIRYRAFPAWLGWLGAVAGAVGSRRSQLRTPLLGRVASSW
jgi:hypothetical protein